MFVQVIQAKVKDADGVRNAMESWKSEVGPKAQGWLGTTAGITPDKQLVAVARFESEEVAMKNSDSPEQSKWWENFSQNLDGEATFFNSSGVTVAGGGSDDAGFVQVMQGKVKDIEKAKALDARMEQDMSQKRPDVIGSLTAYKEDDGAFYSVIYFTSLEEARQGEKEMTENPPPEMAEWGQLMAGEMKFYDLEEPLLVSP